MYVQIGEEIKKGAYWAELLQEHDDGGHGIIYGNTLGSAHSSCEAFCGGSSTHLLDGRAGGRAGGGRFSTNRR